MSSDPSALNPSPATHWGIALLRSSLGVMWIVPAFG
jgi:hypothetical protein